MNIIQFIKHLMVTTVLLFVVNNVFSQCEIKSKMNNDGNLYYYMDPVVFYNTNAKKLSGSIFTDKEYYYINFLPFPIPSKEVGKKLKEDIEIKLSDGKKYKLEFYYSDYENNDSTFIMMYLIDKKDLEAFMKFEVESVKFNMGKEEGERIYNFKLHKKALREELNCFTKKEEE